MAIQTSYGFTHDIGHEGQLQHVETCDVITVWSDEALYPGRVVVLPGTYAEDSFGRPKVVNPSADGQTPYGVIAYVRNEELSGDIDALDVLESTQTRAYKPGTAVPLLIRGVIKMHVEEAANPTNTVHFRYDPATAPNDVVGRVRTDVDTDNADALPGAKFVGSTTGAGLIDVRINMTA